MSLGFEQSGFTVAAAVEIDPVHATIHHYNFPRSATIVRSVTGLSGAEIRKRLNPDARSVDVVIGGAPCQGFSMIGHRALDDPRNSLVREYVRIVAELDASYFVFENVKGLTVGRHRRFLEEVIEAFASCGYDVRLPWRVLNAACYGVPQNRERLFLLGAKRGLGLPDYPAAIVRPADEDIGDERLPVGPSCADALGDIPDAEDYDDLWEDDSVRTSAWGSGSSYAREMRCESLTAWHAGSRRLFPEGLLTCSSRTRHTEISRRRFAETQPGTVEPISRFYKLSADGLSNTLRAGTDAARGAFTSPRPIHYKFPRCVTVREMARLHGYPDWFRFHKTVWHGARQIGNSVPPPLARAVAGAVLRALGRRATHPKSAERLGEDTLLGLDVSAASTYWGVPSPRARRDRKSGARKRKQVEIEELRLASVG
jgi:DNA (cytosine-5)-methyltransferase 1